jgi:hypothetical protein
MGKYRFTLSVEFDADDDPQARRVATNLQRAGLPDMRAKLQALYVDKQPRPIELDGRRPASQG